MSEKRSTHELLLRYVDNGLSSDERTDVEELLRSDANTRDLLRDLAHQAVVIADVARGSLGAATSAHTSNNGAENTTRSASWPIVLAAVVALALVAVSVSQFLQRPDREPEIVTINALNGPIEWIGDGGRVTEELAVGKVLPGGTIELLSANSWIEFEFQDESTVTLSGQSAVTISEQEQKELHLRYGSLSACVRPQPQNRPMMVHTPSAELKVLGTQFNVDALPEATRLVVNEGRVRLKRLTDGKEVDVPERHAVTASLEDQNGLPLIERREGVSIWKSDLKVDVAAGKWVSDLWMLRVRLKKAVANGELDKADAMSAYKSAATFDPETGSVWAAPSHYGSLVVLSVVRSTETPVLLNANARIRVRGRLHSHTPIRIGITTQEPGGGFAGKYSVSVDHGDLLKDGGEFDLTFPITDLRELSNGGTPPTDKELSDWWCVTESSSAKVEITGVEIIE